MARRSRVLQVARGVKRRLQRVVSKTRDAGERVRATILLLYAEGRSSAEIAAAAGYDCAGYHYDPDCNPDCHDDGRTEITDEELARLIARDPERHLAER